LLAKKKTWLIPFSKWVADHKRWIEKLASELKELKELLAMR